MSTNYNLPPGVSANDPHINPPDSKECDDCEGTGRTFFQALSGKMFKIDCPVCDATGAVDDDE